MKGSKNGISLRMSKYGYKRIEKEAEERQLISKIKEAINA